MRRVLILLLVAVLVVTAGCVSQPGDAGDNGNKEADVVDNYEVITVEGEKFVCFDRRSGGDMECSPLNQSEEATDF